MPYTVPEDPGAYPSQTAPEIGDSRTVASIQTPLIQAGQRAAFIKARVDNIDPTGDGARRLRAFETIAAMKAATSLTHNTVALVIGKGLYRYSAGSTEPVVEPAVVAPNLGSGRWLLTDLDLVNAPLGRPSLDASGLLPTSRLAASSGGNKVLAGNVTNGILQTAIRHFPGSSSTTSNATFADIGGPQALDMAIEMMSGDAIHFFGSATMQLDAGAPGAMHRAHIVCFSSGPMQVVDGSEAYATCSSLGNKHTIPVSGLYTAASDGLYTFKLEHKVEPSGTVTIQNIMFRGMHIRP